MKGKLIKSLVAAGCMLVAASSIHIYVSANAEKDRICDGIYIGSINVGGMTEQKARKKLENYVKDAKDEILTVKIDKEKVTTTLEELGYSCDVDSFISKAYNYGKTGDIIKRYKERKDVEKKKVVYDLAFQLDNQKVEKFVEEKCTVFDVKAKNATLKRKKGEFKIKEETNGREIVVDETAEKIEKVIAKQWVTGGIEVDAIMNDTTPKYTAEMVEECTDVLGSFSTSFASSGSERSQNLVNAARLIDGTILYPGEVFFNS